MANALYNAGRQGFLAGDIDWDANNIKVQLRNATTLNQANVNLSDLNGTAVATSGNLTSKGVTNGTATAANVTFTGVSGSQATAMVVYKDTGTASTSTLIAFIDSATNFPVTPNGGDIIISWNASGIFTL